MARQKTKNQEDPLACFKMIPFPLPLKNTLSNLSVFFSGDKSHNAMRKGLPYS